MVKKYDMKIRVFNEDPYFGKGVVYLLEGVEKYGSVLQSTQAMKMAPSKAYKILNRAEKDLGFKLVDSQTGGKNGGGSSLTAEAKELIRRYHQFVDEVNAYANKAFERCFLDE
ncbi:MAG: ModE family transcriptional regulator [Holdemanella sp.]|nr:ModE family transcriptional regulator [Holdemanella sp.]